MIASRRRFFFGGAALALAPAVAWAENIMRIKPPTLILYGDGIHDDTQALNAVLSGKRVWSMAKRAWLQATDEDFDLPVGDYCISGIIPLDLLHSRT